MRVAIIVALGSLPLAGCQKSIEGTYNLENGPVAGVVTTFGPKQFGLKRGARLALGVVSAGRIDDGQWRADLASDL